MKTEVLFIPILVCAVSMFTFAENRIPEVRDEYRGSVKSVEEYVYTIREDGTEGDRYLSMKASYAPDGRLSERRVYDADGKVRESTTYSYVKGVFVEKRSVLPYRSTREFWTYPAGGGKIVEYFSTASGGRENLDRRETYSQGGILRELKVYDGNGKFLEQFDVKERSGETIITFETRAYSLTYYQDSSGRLVRKVYSAVGSGTGSWSFNFAYDGAGNLSEGAFRSYMKGIPSKSWKFTWTSFGKPESIRVYDEAGKLTEERFQTYENDTLREEKAVYYDASGKVKYVYTTAYDPVGSIAGKVFCDAGFDFSYSASYVSEPASGKMAYELVNDESYPVEGFEKRFIRAALPMREETCGDGGALLERKLTEYGSGELILETMNSIADITGMRETDTRFDAQGSKILTSDSLNGYLLSEYRSSYGYDRHGNWTWKKTFRTLNEAESYDRLYDYRVRKFTYY